MHEVSIAASIAEGVCEEASKQGVDHVDAVHVRIGAMAGVVKDSLSFAWDVVVADTLLAGSRLQIEEIPLTVYCPACETERTPTSPAILVCPVCQAPTPRILSGREMQVVGMEVSVAVPHR
ncbi:MAG: hydrogenase maturation nickel metallochaperone HypA [Candidatus Eremiobacteraeota bacterium]|nr:hydrogenase maturation nickel metallochaperone HypA [Candidatus Eremiobacteraeota bacterium]MBC5828357.1 hydrogenase maturation nickel metallochaperone HypA [Candidatus Eremiobacteraeota bacterium]